MSLEGKVCIITGAASGIGLATLKTFLAEGARGVTAVDLQESALTSVKDSLPAQDAERVLLVAGDVSEQATVEEYVAKTIEKWGQLDISVQCAGISQKRLPLLETNVSVLDRIWKVNVRGLYIGLQKSIQAMMDSPAKGEGCSVILISSQIGLDGMPGLAAYSASKSAVRGMMSSVAQEVGPLGIRVNAVCPGPIDTPLVSSMSAEVMKVHTDKGNLKRMGKPEEIASAILFLAGPAGSYCSGTTLKVDGGWSKFC